MGEIKVYNKEIEDLFIQFMISDPELYVRCKGIIKPQYFSDKTNQLVIDFFDRHTEEYNTLPALEQIFAVTGKKGLEKLKDINENHIDWFLTEFEQFCRHKALEKVILSSVDLLQERRYGEVEKAVKEAVQIGLVKNLGTDYFYDPVSRLNRIKENKGMHSTGWRDIDSALYGGMNRGELQVWAGQSGAGKSVFLQNQAVNWAQQGLHVVYVTLELSENLCAMRLDAMVTGVGTRDILKNIDDVAMRVKNFKTKNKGSIRLKQLPNGCTANDIRAFVKEIEVQTGIKADAIIVDYLDLMMPNSARVSPSDMFVKDKYVSEELRNLAIELNTLLSTASQLNRGSYDAVEYDPSNISGGISKVNTADNVMGIFTSAAMRESGRYQIQFMKTRSSSGVGKRVDLAFDPATLRIYDLPEGALDSESHTAQSVLSKMRIDAANQSKKTAEPSPEEIRQKTTSLRDIIRRRD